MKHEANATMNSTHKLIGVLHSSIVCLKKTVTRQVNLVLALTLKSNQEQDDEYEETPMKNDGYCVGDRVKIFYDFQ